MIPKIIHYCWFGHNPKSELAERCINSWKKRCPDYKIIEWDEDNFDISSCPLYVRQAYEAKKWAFVTDYVRLKVVHQYGGIYFDTDVELKKKLDPLLHYSGFFGFEDGKCIATGLGFGAVKELPLLLELMQDYEGITFIQEDKSFDKTPCPERNTKIFLRYGLIQNDTLQLLDGNIRIFPSVYMCPIDYISGKRKRSFKTISIHWYSESWKNIEDKRKMDEYRELLKRIETQEKQKKHEKMIDSIVHFPNRMLKRILGEQRYQRLKSKLK